MKINGYNIEIIRGETTSITFYFTDTEGKPFVLLTTDTFLTLQAHFRVKENAYAKAIPTYILDKILDISEIKRFFAAEILDLQVYSPDDYNPLMWDDNFYPTPAYMDRLFYHHDLKEYRYYNDDLGEWVPYNMSVTVPFEMDETEGLDYKEYVYDLVIEAGNTTDVIEYTNVLINQHKFVVSYRV